MKTIAIVLLLALSSQVFAVGTCPNLNGVYRVNDIAAVRFTQNECVSLSVAWGTIQEHGKIEWYAPTRSLLNGPAKCDTFGCVTAKANAEQIIMSRDKAWTHDNAAHGICDFNQVRYALDAQGNLVGHHDVLNCQDGFTGQVEVLYPRLN